jgi:hypothetical protein
MTNTAALAGALLSQFFENPDIETDDTFFARPMDIPRID